MFDLIVIGHLLKEKILFADGKKVGPVLGGPAGYASVAAARLGLRVGLVTKIGRDMPAELLEVLTEVGVDTEGIRIGQDTTTNLLVYENSGAKRLDFLKKAEDILFEEIPEKYLGARFFLVAPIDYEIPESLIKALHQRGKRLSMELSGFGGASSRKEGRVPKEERIDFVKGITPYFEIVKGGLEDCRCLFDDHEGRGLSSLHPGAAIATAVAKVFIAWGAKVAIITLGEEGVYVMSEEHSFYTPSFPTEVIDCTGAGDVWHAGFLADYLINHDLRRTAGFASATAAFVITNTGGIKSERFPDREKVTQLLDATGKEGS